MTLQKTLDFFPLNSQWGLVLSLLEYPPKHCGWYWVGRFSSPPHRFIRRLGKTESNALYWKVPLSEKWEEFFTYDIYELVLRHL
jgi:hypothetical protein